MFSIIIPIFNVEDYLEECVNSILSQSYKNYEIILVDDGSPDNCPKICDEYKQNYDNIEVIHKKNGGLSDARNVGLQHAKGKYIIFIDSDDFVCDNNYLNDIANLVLKKEYDVILYGKKKYYDKTKKYSEIKLRKINNSDNLIEDAIKYNYYKAAAWDKVIRYEILKKNKILFPLGQIGEDIEWCARLLKNVDYKKIGFINKNYYVYRQRENSICKKLTEEQLASIFKTLQNEKMKDNSYKASIVNSYLAYEFVVRIGRIYSIEADKNALFNLATQNEDILKYDLNNKVKIVNILIRIIGLKNTAKMLGIYIKKKQSKR